MEQNKQNWFQSRMEVLKQRDQMKRARRYKVVKDLGITLEEYERTLWIENAGDAMRLVAALVTAGATVYGVAAKRQMRAEDQLALEQNGES